MARSKSFELLTDNRKDSFSKMLMNSRKLDIASAYVSAKGPWEQIKNLAKKNEIRIRLVAGLDGAVTSPEVLATVSPGIKVKIYIKNDGGSFHPKLYIFHTTSGTKEVFLGSANLTHRGFELNEEILLHVTDPKTVGKCQEYFEDIWRKSLPCTKEYLQQYEKLHQMAEARRSKNKDQDEEVLNFFGKRAGYPESAPSDGSFLEYCSLICQVLKVSYTWLDEYISSSQDSNNLFLLLDVLEECNSLIACSSDQYEHEEILKIKGTKNPYAFLGKAERTRLCAYSNKRRLNDKERESRKFMHCLKAFSAQNFGRNISKRLKETSQVLDEVLSFEGVGMTSASRFMTLSRPDLMVSYNSASERMLEAIAGLESAGNNKIKKKNNYIKLLEFIWRQSWYKNKPKSLDSIQERIWNNRAAMIDVLVYDAFWNSKDEGKKPLKEKILRFFSLSPKELE